jgi:hypothetical protein
MHQAVLATPKQQMFGKTLLSKFTIEGDSVMPSQTALDRSSNNTLVQAQNASIDAYGLLASQYQSMLDAQCLAMMDDAVHKALDPFIMKPDPLKVPKQQDSPNE